MLEGSPDRLAIIEGRGVFLFPARAGEVELRAGLHEEVEDAKGDRDLGWLRLWIGVARHADLPAVLILAVLAISIGALAHLGIAPRIANREGER